MKKLLYSISIILCLCTINSLSAQSYTTQGVKELKNKGPIYEQLAVKGYFIFYQPQKKKSKSLRVLEVLDENLQLIFKKEFEDAKNQELKEMHVLDGNYYLKLEDRNKKKITLQVLGKNGNVLYEDIFRTFFTYPKTDQSYGQDLSSLSILENQLTTIHSIPDVGVFSYSFESDKGIKKFVIHFFGENDGGLLSWKYVYDKEPSKISTEFLNVKNNTLFNLVFREIYLDTKHGSRAYVEGIDLNNGELVFSNELSSAENKTAIKPTWFKVQSNNDKIMMHGWFYKLKFFSAMRLKKLSDEEIAEVKFPGYMIAEINADGSVLKESKIPFMHLRSFYPKRKNGKVFQCTFHNIIHTKEGSFLVLESFRHTRKLIKNLVLIELNEDYEMIETHIFEKPERKARINEILPRVSRYGNWGQDADLENANYGYAFTSYSSNKKDFTIAYQGERYKQKDSKLSWLLGTVTRIDGEFVHDFYFQESKADYLYALPAPYGSMLILEHELKTKEVNLYFNTVEKE